VAAFDIIVSPTTIAAALVIALPNNEQTNRTGQQTEYWG
jgi:hypothetical protein